MSYHHTGLSLNVEENVFISIQIFTFNSRLWTCENASSYFYTEPFGLEVWGLEWIRSLIPLLRQDKNYIQMLPKQLAALWSDNEPNHLTQALYV